MFAVFKSQKRHKLRSLESKLYDLVEKKERKIEAIDESGRDMVMVLREYLDQLEGNSKSHIPHRRIITEAQRYIRENQHYH